MELLNKDDFTVIVRFLMKNQFRTVEYDDNFAKNLYEDYLKARQNNEVTLSFIQLCKVLQALTEQKMKCEINTIEDLENTLLSYVDYINGL